MMKLNYFKTIISIFLTLSMILPAGLIVSGDIDSSSVLAATPGMDAESSSLTQVGNAYYQVWIEGKTHDARLKFSMSQDGESWNQPIFLTSAADFTPMNVNMIAGTNTLHISWMDGVSRMLSTGYMSVDFAGQKSRPIAFKGENPSMDAQGSQVAIATSDQGQLNVHLSQDAGKNFQSQTIFDDLSTSINSISLDNGLEIVAKAGVRNLDNGKLSQTGLYFTSFNGVWTSASKIADAGAVKSLELNSEGITWTEEDLDSIDTYFMKELAPGEFNLKELVSSELKNIQLAPASVAPTRLPPKKWTYVCYLDADNNLDSFGYEDVNEMENIGSDADVNMVVLFDGLGSGDSRAWYIEQDADTGSVTSPEIALSDINPGWGTELNMGDPQTAIDWLNYVYANYPADRMMLDMWNHGGSWNWGMCSDDTDGGDNLVSEEIRSIYEQLRIDNNRIKLYDVAGYDECLMSDVSTDYDEIPYIDYICNSEDSIAGDGWEYDLVLGPLVANPDMGAEEAAWLIFDAYVDFYGTSGSLTTMSIINSKYFYIDLIPAINRLAQKGMHDITANRAAIQTAANNAMDWQGYTHQKDLIHFCENIVAGLPANEISAAAQDVIDMGQALPVGTEYGDPGWDGERAIIIHNQNANENGITIYAASAPYDTVYDTMTFTETNWDEFYQVLWGSDADQPNNEPAVVISSPPNGGFVTIDTTVAVSGTSSDTDGTVQSVEVAVGNEHFEPAVGTDPWTFNWDTTGWAPGWYWVQARSFDGQDYSEPYQIEVQIIVDPDLPDLTLWPSDIGFDNPTPNEGDTVTIDATVYNVGTVDTAFGVEIGFYDGDPILADLIGITSASPSTLPAGNTSGWGEFAWDTTLEAGFHDIYVVADPNFTVPELTDSNNTAIKQITVAGYNVDVDCVLNNSIIQAGNDAVYDVTITNTGTLTDTIDLTINNPSLWVAYLSQPSVTLASLASQIITLTVEGPVAALPNEFVLVDVIGTSQNNPLKDDAITTRTSISPAIVVIDDSGGDTGFYETALTNAGYLFDVGPTTTDLTQYEVVVWVCDGVSTLQDSEKTALADFLEGGGAVYINGEDIGYDIATDDDTGTIPAPNTCFYTDYMHADYLADDSGAATMDGVPGDPITDGMFGLTVTGSFPDNAGPIDAEAIDIFDYDTSGAGGLRIDTGTYRLVYISCEYFESSDPQPNKDLLMDRIMTWLGSEPTPKAIDAQLDSTDSHTDAGTYPTGAQDVITTVSNQGATSQGPFDVNCLIERNDVIPYTEYYNDDMESGWTSADISALSVGDLWQQDGGHAYAGATGYLCGGLAGDYVNSMDNTLTSGTIDLSTALTPLYLSFWTDYDCEGSTYDNMWVEFNAGSGWETQMDPDTGFTYYPSVGGDESSGWVQKIYDASAYAGQSIDMRFRFQTDTSVTYGNGVSDGWEGVYVDDVIFYAMGSSWITVLDNDQATVGTMDQFDTQQLSWNYNFDTETDYRITITTLLAGDEVPLNNQDLVQITIAGGMPTTDIPVAAVAGWNFISFPLAISGSPDVVLNDLAGDGTTQWDVIKWYDATDPADPWKTYRIGAGNNDLITIDNCAGLWVHITVPGDNLLTVQGTTPGTTNIQLYTGWNLVGYPSATPRAADTTLPVQADVISVYDGGSPYLITDESNLSSVIMSDCNAYWVHVSADCLWAVNY